MSAWRCSTQAIGPSCFSIATALQRQELKQQCGSVVNTFRTVSFLFFFFSKFIFVVVLTSPGVILFILSPKVNFVA